MVHLGRTGELLRRHVPQGSHGLIAGGQAGKRLSVHQLGQPEVGDLHRSCLVYQDVLGLDVTVHDAPVVGVLQRGADLGHDGQGLARIELATLHQLPKVRAVHELHHDPGQALLLVKVMDRDDARVGQFRQGLGLPQEALFPAVNGLRRGQEDLDRHLSIKARLMS